MRGDERRWCYRRRRWFCVRLYAGVGCWRGSLSDCVLEDGHFHAL